MCFRVCGAEFIEFYSSNHQDEKNETFSAHTAYETGKTRERSRNPSAVSGYHLLFVEVAGNSEDTKHPAPCVSVSETRGPSIDASGGVANSRFGGRLCEQKPGEQSTDADEYYRFYELGRQDHWSVLFRGL